jgi:hypothetical protein
MRHEIVFDTVFKGGADAANVHLLLPGGRVGFSDGSFAQVNVPDFRPMVKGRRYLVFLRPRPVDSANDPVGLGPVFEPAFGALGIYDVTDLSVPVRPNGGWDSSFATLLRDDRVRGQALLDQVQQEVKR